LLKAHEVTTVFPMSRGDYRRLSVGKYIVVAKTTSRAISLIHLRDGEEVLEAHELEKHQVIVEVQDGTGY
jgi:hypothetical protein